MMLVTLSRDRVTLVWLALILATSGSWLLGVGNEFPSTYAAIGIIAIAFVKVRLVGRYFMELRQAPIALQALFELWVLGAAAALMCLYVLA